MSCVGSSAGPSLSHIARRQFYSLAIGTTRKAWLKSWRGARRSMPSARAMMMKVSVSSAAQVRKPGDAQHRSHRPQIDRHRSSVHVESKREVRAGRASQSAVVAAAAKPVPVRAEVAANPKDRLLAFFVKLLTQLAPTRVSCFPARGTRTRKTVSSCRKILHPNTIAAHVALKTDH